MYTTSTETDYASIIIGIITAVIGFVLLYIGIRRKGRIMIPIAILILAIAVTIFFEFERIREVVVAFSSLAAVIIAAMSIDQANRLRQDSIDKENRDRRQKQLDEIAEWAVSIFSAGSDINYEYYGAQQNIDNNTIALRAQVRIRTLWGRYRPVLARVERIKVLAENFKEEKLLEAVDDTSKKLNEYINVIAGISDGNHNINGFRQTGQSLFDAVNSLIIIVSTTKV